MGAKHQPRLPMSIRPYALGDGDAVMALWRGCGLVGADMTSPGLALARARDLAHDATILIASPVSSVWLVVATVMAGYDELGGWIDYIAIAPAFRDRDIERDLVAASQAWMMGQESSRTPPCAPVLRAPTRAPGQGPHNSIALQALMALGRRRNTHAA